MVSNLFQSTDSSHLSQPWQRVPVLHTYPTPILLVDDVPSLHALKRSLLQQAGYEIRAEAADGLEALHYLQVSAVPHIVVFNTRMPNLDGIAFLRIVAGTPWLRRHAFVLNTALARMMPEELARLVDQLGIPVVGKPFQPEELFVAVAYARRALQTRVS